MAGTARNIGVGVARREAFPRLGDTSTVATLFAEDAAVSLTGTAFLPVLQLVEALQ